MKHLNPVTEHFLLISSLSLFFVLFLLQPASARNPIDVISPGGTVFIGESGLDITAAVPAIASIAWWASGADINVTAPTRIIFPSDRLNFYISPSDFVGYTGNWYVYTGSPPPASLAFVVQDPALDLGIEDVTTGTDITNGVIVPGDEIGFTINSNLYIGDPGTPISINITAPEGSYYTTLVNKSGATTILNNILVSSQPFRTGAIWDSSNSLYLAGVYSVRAECNMNGMKDNYKNAGADYTGKTVSQTYSITLVPVSPPYQDTGGSDSGSTGGGTTSSVAIVPGVAAGTAATFSFAPDITGTSPAGVTGVQLVTTRTLGQTEITVTNLPIGTLTGLNGQPVARYVDVVAVGINPNAIDQATITFSVYKDWLTQQGLTPSDIVGAYDNKGVWTYLPTTYTGENGNSYTFTMTTQNLGYFAITVVKTGIETGIPPVIKSERSQAATTVSQSTPLGFAGMSFNADGQNTLDISLADAQAAGATVTSYFNRIEVYQHHSPGVTITFWGDNFTITRDRIVGKASRAEFVTDPLNAALDFGNVSGSVHATLPMLTQRALINTTISEAVSAETLGQFREIANRNMFTLQDVAYTLEVKKINLKTGPANVTFTIPTSWVNLRGGSSAVQITRISEDTGKTELLSTTYIGIDPYGNMIFRGDSPDGTSIFGLITSKAIATEQKEHPNMTYVPVSNPAIVTDVGIVGWLLGIIRDNPMLLVAVIAIFTLLGLWTKRF